MKLYCKKCNEAITVVDLSEVGIELVNLNEEKDLIPEGKFIKADKLEFNFGVAIKYLVNENSVRLNNHKDSKRLQGCCGPSNFDSLNQVCPNCSYEIGVISGDCWMPHFVGISEETVSLKPLW